MDWPARSDKDMMSIKTMQPTRVGTVNKFDHRSSRDG